MFLMTLKRNFKIRLCKFCFTLGIYNIDAFWSSTILKSVETYHSHSTAPPHHR